MEVQCRGQNLNEVNDLQVVLSHCDTWGQT
jgi:hypothetical protein